MPERTGSAGGEDRFLVFSVGGRPLALPAGRVREIVRVPPLQRVPLAPPALLGLMNLRGTVLPVVDLAGAAGRRDLQAGRILVVEAGAPLGLMAERVVALASGRRDGGSSPDSPSGFSDGLIRLADGTAAHLVALDRLLGELFPGFGRRPARSAAPKVEVAPVQDKPGLALVSFEVSGQDYALPLERVAEIVALPEELASVPLTDDHVLGVLPLRERLLAIVSTARLLGLPGQATTPETKVVVARVRGTLAGLVVDRIKSILRIDERSIDQVPALLRSDGAEIQAICRPDGGRRLISILSTDGLFDEAVMRRIATEQTQGRESAGETASGTDGEQFLLFRVANDLFGLPIDAVQEVVRVPETLTRIPRAPAFVEGLMNLRGTALPLIDQRRRFDLPPAGPGERRRVIVLSSEGTQAGFIVDEVTEVRRLPSSAIMAAPELADDQSRVVPRVSADGPDGSLILLVDPKALLDTTERRLLGAISRDAKARPAA